MLTIVGQGLVGTLAGLEAERRGVDFRIVDLEAGATSSRAAAGIFNPLIGPRFSRDNDDWAQLLPYYQRLEVWLGVSFVHEMPILRPLSDAKVEWARVPREGAGWSSELSPQRGEAFVLIRGGGWIDLGRLLDAGRARWLSQGRLEERLFASDEGAGQRVLWCCGPRGFEAPWEAVPGVTGRWQAVRGDVLTVECASLGLETIELGPRFLVPLGETLYRWGATHEMDVLDFGYREAARAQLEAELDRRLAGHSYRVVDHRWGVRPASRVRAPLVVKHPDETGWLFVNGFGGRGVSQAPAIVAGLF